MLEQENETFISNVEDNPLSSLDNMEHLSNDEEYVLVKKSLLKKLNIQNLSNSFFKYEQLNFFIYNEATKPFLILTFSFFFLFYFTFILPFLLSIGGKSLFLILLFPLLAISFPKIIFKETKYIWGVERKFHPLNFFLIKRKNNFLNLNIEIMKEISTPYCKHLLFLLYDYHNQSNINSIHIEDVSASLMSNNPNNFLLSIIAYSLEKNESPTNLNKEDIYMFFNKINKTDEKSQNNSGILKKVKRLKDLL